MGFKLGSVYIDHVEEVGRNSSSPATSNALEDNTEMSDHMEMQPKTISFQGVILDPDNKKLGQIESYQEKRQIIDFNYMTSLKSVVVESFDVTYHKDIKDGYNFSMQIKQIKVVGRKKIAVTSGMVNRMTKNKKNMGLHVVKKTKEKDKTKVTKKTKKAG